jgi:hypothetical protein
MPGTLPTPQEYIEIVAVLTRYATALDSKNKDLLMSCFSTDATADYPRTGHHQGNRTIAESVLSVVAELDSTQHLLGNHVIERETDGAKATTELHAQHSKNSAKGAELFTVGGRYHDRLELLEGAWKIVHRRLEVVWSTGNASILAGDWRRA